MSRRALRKERGRLQAAVHNFIGTYTSRYSSWDGYWLFGFLIESPSPLQVDLLDERPSTADSPLGFAASLAQRQFQAQVRKSGGIGDVRSASLVLEREGPEVERLVNGQPRIGHMMRVTVSAAAHATVETTTRIFVAPHDPGVEGRTWRAPYGGAGNPRTLNG